MDPTDNQRDGTVRYRVRPLSATTETPVPKPRYTANLTVRSAPPVSFQPETVPIQQEASITELISAIQSPRQADETITHQVSEKNNIPIISRKMYTVIGLGVIVVIIGSVLLSIRPKKETVVLSAQDTTESARAIETNLDESQPTEEDISAHSVPATEPRYVSVPSIGLKKSRIISLGRDRNGAIESPANIYDVGWFGESSVPGASKKAPLLFGHVVGPYEEGAFYNLYRLTIGDEITITNGAGANFVYRVVEKQDILGDTINLDVFLASKGDSQGLTLMTISGEFNPATNTSENRTVVFAVRSK